jgi:hypothetical protein
MTKVVTAAVWTVCKVVIFLLTVRLPFPKRSAMIRRVVPYPNYACEAQSAFGGRRVLGRISLPIS